MTSRESHDDDDVVIASRECCMCGDYGLSQEIFRCRVCLSRFQHRYCSDLYPKTGTIKVCNWCISKQGDKLQRSQSSVSVTYRNNEGEEEKEIKKKTSSKKEKRAGSTSGSQLHANSSIKKQVHSEQSIGRRRNMLRRTKSEGRVNGGMIKQVFRGKVQRYKLLQDVSIR